MTAHRHFSGRADRIRAHLTANPKGVTLRGLIAAIEPGCGLANMGSSLNTMVKHKKVRTVGAGGDVYYLPTATMYVDGRVASNAARAGQSRAVSSKPPVVARVTTIAAACRSSAKKAAPVATTANGKPTPAAPTGVITSIAARQADRDASAVKVAAFLAQGGVIQKLGWGECAASIAEQQQRFHEQRQRGAAAKTAKAAARVKREADARIAIAIAIAIA